MSNNRFNLTPTVQVKQMMSGMVVMKWDIRYAKNALTVTTPKTPNNKFNRTALRLPVNLML